MQKQTNSGTYEKGGLIGCAEKCKEYKVDCPCKTCDYWLNYEEDLNCTLIGAQVNGPMSLRDIAKRFGVSHVMIQQIEDKALAKVKRMIAKEDMKCENKKNNR